MHHAGAWSRNFNETSWMNSYAAALTIDFHLTRSDGSVGSGTTKQNKNTHDLVLFKGRFHTFFMLKRVRVWRAALSFRDMKRRRLSWIKLYVHLRNTFIYSIRKWTGEFERMSHYNWLECVFFVGWIRSDVHRIKLWTLSLEKRRN